MEKKKILVFKGSPKPKGNTSLMADRATQGALEAGVAGEISIQRKAMHAAFV